MPKRIFVFCPSLLRFKEPPKDQPGCIEKTCPECHKQMWMSHKKRTIKALANPDELYMVCYDCFEEKVKTDPVFFEGIEKPTHI